ncbi:MAG: hypothetical protein K6E59_03330 [Bacilli bacterium]|nr:hypothetical protein [Bacilli bacterium]
MKKHQALLVAIAALTLAACTPSGSSSSESEKSTIISTEVSTSTGTESSSSQGESSYVPTTGTFNARAAVEMIAYAARKYNKNVTVQGLIDQLNACGESFDFAAESETKASEILVTVALYYAFKDSMPEKIGARSFQAFYADIDEVEIRNAADSSKNSITYKAMKFFSDLGVYTVRSGSSISGKTAMTAKLTQMYLDRLHYYIGTSYQDDFFAAVNHDYLYDNNPHRDDPSDGQLDYDYDGDGDVDEDDKGNIYDSKLIPEEDIVDWSLDLIKDNIPAAQNFIDTYCDWGARAAGNASGLVAGVEEYLAASTPKEFYDVCLKQAKEQGFCVLWSTAQSGFYNFEDGRKEVLLNLEPYSFSGTAASVSPDSAGYNTSVDRFAPIFQEVLGCTEEAARQYAVDYTMFKYRMATFTERMPDDQYAFLANEDNESRYLDNVILGDTNLKLYDFFTEVGFKKASSIMYSSRNSIDAIAKMFTDKDLPLLKGLAVWQMLQHYTICLPDAEHVNAWAYRPGYANNKETLWDNKAMFYSYGLSYLSEIISNYYVQTDDFKANSAAVVGLVNQVKGAMTSRINAADWLSKDAKDKSQLKLDNMSYCIGGDVNGTTVLTFDDFAYKSAQEGSLYQNIGLHQLSALANDAEHVGDDWGEYTFDQYVAMQDPLTANAFYMPSFNGIYITLGYMACYDGAAEMNELDLLSSYGWVASHEISHGFDSNGIYYNEKGEYQEDGWFVGKDKTAYANRCKAVTKFYNGYEVMTNQGTPGSTVNTEAIADINGLHLCMEVAKGFEGFDYAQFFINCADHFGDYASQYTYAMSLASDEHPFGRCRVNRAVSCMDEFYEAFDVVVGDGMYVAPEDRIVIW